MQDAQGVRIRIVFAGSIEKDYFNLKDVTSHTGDRDNDCCKRLICFSEVFDEVNNVFVKPFEDSGDHVGLFEGSTIVKQDEMGMNLHVPEKIPTFLFLFDSRDSYGFMSIERFDEARQVAYEEADYPLEEGFTEDALEATPYFIRVPGRIGGEETVRVEISNEEFITFCERHSLLTAPEDLFIR